jgi:hypothetical protein
VVVVAVAVDRIMRQSIASFELIQPLLMLWKQLTR